MTQTQTTPHGSRDPDRRPDPDPDSGPDATQTRTQTPAQTQTQTPVRTQTNPDPSLGLGPDAIQTRTQTQTQTQTRTLRARNVKILNRPEGSGLGNTQTQTQTETQTETDLGEPRRRVQVPHYPGGWFARHKAGRAAKRMATEEAILRGAEAELVILEAEARAEMGPDDDTQHERLATTAVRDWMTRGGYLKVLTAIVAVVAAIGQKVYAETKAGFVGQIQINGFDLTPWFAPAVFDLAVAAMLHGGLRAARERLSPWPWWGGASVVAGLSIWTNTMHVGAQITGSASAGLFLMWGLYLLGEYKKIIRKREIEDSAADDFTSTDVLFTVDKRLADCAWRIARTKPLDAALDYRHKLGETRLSKRDMVILVARTYIDVYDDELYALMNPHLAARPVDAAPAGKDAKPTKARKVRWYQWTRLKRARRLAAMTAGDNVDRYLGVPVPDRRGVIVARVTYNTAQDDTPLLGAVTVKAPALPVATAAAPAAPALPAAPVVVPTPRQRTTAAPAALPAGEGAEPPVVVMPGRPSGNRGMNWMPLSKIPGLPEIDPATLCECSITKPCGETLVEHVERRGRYVDEIVTTVADWGTREERIGKNVVRDVCRAGGSGIQNEVAGLFDHLQKLFKAQRAGKDAAASGAATVEVAES